MTTGEPKDNEGTDAMPVGIASTDQLGAAPKRCTGDVKCSEDARYDQVAYGPYSLTLKCRLCGAIVRHDWD